MQKSSRFTYLVSCRAAVECPGICRCVLVFGRRQLYVAYNKPFIFFSSVCVWSVPRKGLQN